VFWKRPQVLDVLNANNLKFATNDSGQVQLNLGRQVGMLDVDNTPAEPLTPKALYDTLDGQERAEKEYMRTGKRPLAIDNKPKDSDYNVARLIASHLTNKSLKKLADRGLHGAYAGNRAKMEEAVADLLYKGTFGRDLYTNTYTGNMPTQMGHTFQNIRGGKISRQELAAINMTLKALEGEEKLNAIAQKRRQLNGMTNLQNNPELINDPDIARLVMGDKTFVNEFLEKAKNYGFNITSGTSTRINSPGNNRDIAYNIR
jgi:hypothetical protein